MLLKTTREAPGNPSSASPAVRRASRFSMTSSGSMLSNIGRKLKAHAPFTAGMYRLHSTGKLWATIVVGYFGSIGIATLSDCIIPYLGESLLGLRVSSARDWILHACPRHDPRRLQRVVSGPFRQFHLDDGENTLSVFCFSNANELL